MQELLVRPGCSEFRHDLCLPTIEEMPLTQNESELVLGVNSRFFYLGVRKFIYGVDTPENVDAWVEMEIILFLDGVVNIYPGLVAPPQSRVRKPRLARATKKRPSHLYVTDRKSKRMNNT